MDLPRDRKRRAPGRFALVVVISLLPAGNAAAAAFVLSAIARRPEALAPGDPMPPEVRAQTGSTRLALLVLGEESVEDFWAITAAWEIEQRAPGRVAVAYASERDSLGDAVPRILATSERTARWLRRRLPILPSLVLIDEQGRVSATHPAPFVPGLSCDVAAAFLRGGGHTDATPATIAADTTSPFLPEIADGRQVVRTVAADPAVSAFMERHRARTKAISAALRYEEAIGYFWSVEVRVGACGCSASQGEAVGRVLVRPSDGAVLAREFHMEGAAPAAPAPALRSDLEPPDSSTDLDGRW